MTSYKIFKLSTGCTQLSESIADAVIQYCLNQMTNSDLNFTQWKIGITHDEKIQKGSKLRSWKCLNHIEALQTKKYFLDLKTMQDDTPNVNGTETVIYVYR